MDDHILTEPIKWRISGVAYRAAEVIHIVPGPFELGLEIPNILTLERGEEFIHHAIKDSLIHEPHMIAVTEILVHVQCQHVNSALHEGIRTLNPDRI
jgi:hypothetical protein